MFKKLKGVKQDYRVHAEGLVRPDVYLDKLVRALLVFAKNKVERERGDF